MEIFLANDADVKEGSTLEVDFAGRPAIIMRVNGHVHAYINCCTHVGGPMKLAGDKILCQWHGSAFDAATGQALSEPAPLDSKLIGLPIVIKDGKVYYSY